jgi:hypothetical protein
MTVLAGADSSYPQPARYKGRDIWGVYVAGATPHFWSHEEVHALGAAGVRGVLPIIVPPQGGEWWARESGAETLTRLVAGARAWGLPVGSPLCLDIEQATAEAIGTQARAVEARFAGACRTYGYVPWTYGGVAWHKAVGNPSYALKWLAEWSAASGVLGAVGGLPGGYHALQYAGNVEGGTVDLDIFEPGRIYLDPVSFKPTVINPKGPAMSPVNRETGLTTPDEAETPAVVASEQVIAAAAPQVIAETPQVQSALAVEEAQVIAAVKADEPITPTLAAQIRTHLDELGALVLKALG